MNELQLSPAGMAWAAPAVAPPAPVTYVAGLMFSEDRHFLAVIRKRRPAWQHNRLNAIGGKIEPGEAPGVAMAREFAEETGVETAPDDWSPVAVLGNETFRVHFFAAFDDRVFEVRTIEDEEVAVGYVAGFLGNPDLIPNLRVMIALALDNSGIAKPVALVDAIPAIAA